MSNANTSTHLRAISLVFSAFILWGCAPGTVQAIPTIGVTSTSIPITKALPTPSSTVPLPTVIETEALLASATPLTLCRPGELEAYLAEFSPIADQIVIIAQEATQLEELSESRATEMLAESAALKSDLNTVKVPTCLEPVHIKAIDAAVLLENTLNAILDKDFDTARESLQESFSAISDAVADVVVISWELTATSTPSQ